MTMDGFAAGSRLRGWPAGHPFRRLRLASICFVPHVEHYPGLVHSDLHVTRPSACIPPNAGEANIVVVV
jgi:hypothetical protein